MPRSISFTALVAVGIDLAYPLERDAGHRLSPSSGSADPSSCASQSAARAGTGPQRFGTCLPARHPHGPSVLPRLPVGGAARRVGVGAARLGRARDQPPRRPLRRVRRGALRAEGAAAPARRARVRPADALRAERCRSSRRSASSSDRPDELDAVLITQHLEFSLPYRALFGGRGFADLRERLLDALAQLLVRLHLAGFFWGDCSLSNALFRRDAGALAGVPRRRGDRRAAPGSSPTASASTTSRSPRRTSPASSRRRGRARPAAAGDRARV